MLFHPGTTAVMKCDSLRGQPYGLWEFTFP